jgi:hypothetical protein
MIIGNKKIFLCVRPYFRNEYKTSGIPLIANTAWVSPSTNRPVVNILVKKKVLTKSKKTLDKALISSLNKDLKNKYVKYRMQKIDITYSNLLIKI